MISEAISIKSSYLIFGYEAKIISIKVAKSYSFLIFIFLVKDYKNSVRFNL